ncbi:MAG TPA: DUF362 domain-containing protein [Candidatus Bathyarchaeia archaeon]|nr:DUF362 domain-containing protein [Candidatus Bathyarchaeia archaeon]
MAIQISKKMKIIFVLFAGVIFAGFSYVYQKILGGKALNLPENEYIVGDKNVVTVTPQKEEQVVASIVYSDNIARGIDEVIQKTGNLNFILPGQKVLIKPNVNSDDPAPGTTHPEALAEVVRLAKARGAYVIVGDRSNPNWKTIPAMKTTGMYSAAQEAGADEIVGFEDEEWIRVSPEKAKFWPNGFRIPKRLQEVDHIISVPVLHTHSITGHSLAIKNLVGLIDPIDRMVFHASKNREEMIAEISLAIKPSLVVIDGTRALIRGGPSKGEIAETKVYLASKDVLAGDVLGVTLLEKHGASLPFKNPWDSGQIKHFLGLSLSQFSEDEINKEVSKI